MLDRLLFEIVDGFPEMPAHTHVEQALQKHDLHLNPNYFSLLVLEELLRLDEKNKKNWLSVNRQKLTQRRLDHTIPSIEFVVEDFVSGRYYKVPAKGILDQT